mmetsp:Transcript_100865/g.284542  ORF Transcript_100865/g.284542 Transcript_100865/m.284542 type:complete len:222 (-) Transcript_100865:8-673(-)
MEEPDCVVERPEVMRLGMVVHRAALALLALSRKRAAAAVAAAAAEPLGPVELAALPTSKQHGDPPLMAETIIWSLVTCCSGSSGTSGVLTGWAGVHAGELTMRTTAPCGEEALWPPPMADTRTEGAWEADNGGVGAIMDLPDAGGVGGELWRPDAQSPDATQAVATTYVGPVAIHPECGSPLFPRPHRHGTSEPRTSGMATRFRGKAIPFSAGRPQLWPEA